MKPPKYAKNNTLHILVNRHTGKESTFLWTGTAWSTPGTGWGTKPSGMAALGWKYKEEK